MIFKADLYRLFYIYHGSTVPNRNIHPLDEYHKSKRRWKGI
ncbi:hypothetical protein CHCC14821_1317 [Bacillus paralicheniformis]|nr:hypothetical protein CHCC14821_1317 [Bacillus paralicheniformis]